jgi:hypothetical protein
MARRGQKAAALHGLADLIRFRHGIDLPSTEEARALIENIRAVWNERELDSSSSSSTSSSSTLSTALATLESDVRTIELASGTTVGQLAAIATAFETLKTDGLTPTSQSALKSFENTLVTDLASGTTLTDNATLLSQFEAIYTSSPTTQETTDLTTAYDALASAVTSSNITSADITLINTDWSAVLAARGSASTATFPYFQMVTGQAPGGHGFGDDGDC